MCGVSDTCRNGDVFPSVCVFDFVVEESGVLQLKRAEKGEACTTVLLLIHLQKAFGTSVMEVIVSAVTGSMCITAPRQENLHLAFQPNTNLPWGEGLELSEELLKLVFLLLVS